MAYPNDDANAVGALAPSCTRVYRGMAHDDLAFQHEHATAG